MAYELSYWLNVFSDLYILGLELVELLNQFSLEELNGVYEQKKEEKIPSLLLINQSLTEKINGFEEKNNQLLHQIDMLTLDNQMQKKLEQQHHEVLKAETQEILVELKAEKEKIIN